MPQRRANPTRRTANAAGETGLDGLLRELREELGWQPAEPPRRAVDLHVDGDLIAWFYEAAAPSTDAALAFEPGRRGVWMSEAELLVHPRLSEWHRAVLNSWRTGRDRADFVTRGA